MNEPALTEAVKTDLPSPKPNRRRRIALRFAALVVAVSGLPVCCTSFMPILPSLKPGDKLSLPGYTITDLGTLGGDTSYALAINRAGEIVGEAETSSGKTHAFIWRKGKMHDLGSPGQYYATEAFWSNDKGQVIGKSILIAPE